VQVTSPTRPGLTIEASQQILIEALPPILVLHLKRFLYDTSANGVVKISKTVEFSPELEIANGEYTRKGFDAALSVSYLFIFCATDMMAPGRKMQPPTRYQLYGSEFLFVMTVSYPR